MQAVPAIGSIRPLKPRNQRKMIALAVGKKLIIPIVLICTIMLAIFFPTMIDSTDNIVMSVTTSTQTSQSAAHTQYMVAATTRDSNDGTPTTAPSATDFYVDAKDVVPTYNEALVDKTSSGLTVKVNSPTHPCQDASFVVNVRELVANQYQDIITVEESLGITGHMDVYEYVKKFLQGNYVFGESWYKKYSGFGGAIGPALVDRTYYSENQWLKESGSNTNFWSVLGYYQNPNAKLDLMLVKNEDYDRYFAGEDVSVTYVAYKPVDYKAHTAPWGINQTYMYFDTRGPLSSWPDTGGSGDRDDTDKVTRQESMSDSVLALYRSLQASRTPQYWLPTIAYDREKYNINLGVVNGNVFEVKTGALFETGTNQQYKEFANKFLGAYSLVGVLVYPTVS